MNSVRAIAGFTLVGSICATLTASAQDNLDVRLRALLDQHGFTGDVDQSLEERLGRPIATDLAEIGNLIFFDNIQGLHDDNSCAGCHAPAAGFGDFESIAIGVDNNNIVGPARSGPRNQRRTPMVLNNAFYPKLMWNGRFFAPSGDPFDNSQGFAFTPPEGVTKFPADDPEIQILLAAQGHIPGTELPEMAGFTGITGTLFATQRFFASSAPGGSTEVMALARDAEGSPFTLFPAAGAQALAGENQAPDFAQFDDGHGDPLPPPEPDGTRNEPIRDMLVVRFNESSEYRELFGNLYPDVANGDPITFSMIAQALSEFQVTLTYADAPLDRFARGEQNALTDAQKRGAALFFGEAGCVSCHAVAGDSNEMFSDFEMHNIGVPQIYPNFGVGTGNVPFRNEQGEFVVGGQYDYGLADITEAPNDSDRFKFRTSPLRNVALQRTFFHNGSFTRLEDAIRHHLDVITSVENYDPAAAGVDEDLRNVADMEPVLENLAPEMQEPLSLSEQDFADLVDFVRNGLLDSEAAPDKLMELIPDSVPSGRPLPEFVRP